MTVVENFSGIITKNPVMAGLFHYIESIAASGQPVLILGETGSGKELFAKAIHDASGVSGEFVAIDVSGLDDTLFSDTLFGHKKGAYTGADKNRPGLIEKAGQGTIFLDEIGDLNSSSQVKLLRLLQEGIYYPLGDDLPQKCRARIITATNKKLNMLSQNENEFRRDLYYRLSTPLIQVPPLRERKEDIPLLVYHFLEKYSQETTKKIDSVDKTTLDHLKAYPWPGNVRELENAVERAVVLSKSRTLTLKDFDFLKPGPDSSFSPLVETLTLQDMEKRHIETVLRNNDWNISRSADILGVSRATLHRMINRHGTQKP